MSIITEARLKAEQLYLKRLRDLNVGAEDKTVLDSIDRPMRELIVEMHRVGMKTTFCCCGFQYEDEEEPKTHHATFTYVFVKRAVQGQLAADNINRFLNGIVVPNSKHTWNVSPFNTPKGEPLMHLYYSNPLANLYQNDGQDKTIHDYEPHVMAIRLAVRVAKSLPTAVKEIRIHDGNQDYFDIGITEWQINPKPDYVHNVIKQLEITNE